ncbi:hypothetical protein QP519_11400, partial [Weeksella virosa]|uniref:hypothetical protein n=1 Tax=Weeksella virosa TaxID=1014 RepID=UPI00255731DD
DVPTINPEELGKVDTVDGVAPDENKNVQLNALVKNKVNEVGEDFALKSGNATVRFDENKIHFKGASTEVLIGDAEETGSVFRCVQFDDDGSNLYEVAWNFNLITGSSYGENASRWSIHGGSGRGSRYVTIPITEKYRNLVVSWNGVFADKNGNIDADVEPYIADYFDKETITLKNIPDKTQDATFNQLIGLNNITKELGVVGGAATVNSILSMDNNDPALIALSYKLNGTFSSSTRVVTNGIFPPVIEEGNAIKTLTILGKGLTLPEDENITKVQIVHLQTMNIYDVGWKNVRDNALEVYVNSSLYPIGEYKVKILSGVQAHITGTSFEIMPENSVTAIPTNSLVWEWYKNSKSTITEEESGIKVVEPDLISVTQKGLFGDSFPGIIQDAMVSQIINDIGNFSISLDLSWNLPEGKYLPIAVGLINNDDYQSRIEEYNGRLNGVTIDDIFRKHLIYGVSVEYKHLIRDRTSEKHIRVGKHNGVRPFEPAPYPTYKGSDRLAITRKGNKLYTVFGDHMYVEDILETELHRLIILNCAAVNNLNGNIPVVNNKSEIKINSIETFKSNLYKPH